MSLSEAREAFILADTRVHAFAGMLDSVGMAMLHRNRKNCYAEWIAAVREFRGEFQTGAHPAPIVTS